jgi:hypothetical protein
MRIPGSPDQQEIWYHPLFHHKKMLYPPSKYPRWWVTTGWKLNTYECKGTWVVQQKSTNVAGSLTTTLNGLVRSIVSVLNCWFTITGMWCFVMDTTIAYFKSKHTTFVPINKARAHFKVKFDRINWTTISQLYSTQLILLESYWKIFSNDNQFFIKYFL